MSPPDAERGAPVTPLAQAHLDLTSSNPSVAEAAGASASPETSHPTRAPQARDRAGAAAGVTS